ncbi:hypothetical protein E5288_WYG009674 [Bos mutus]|uniref:Uncharacterized protein n=1 Tax=Bos mutus TaxID=72004 RepID=A0A6B0R0T6_9CETA|nr:hypothetical protein [Bos mutus]
MARSVFITFSTWLFFAIGQHYGLSVFAGVCGRQTVCWLRDLVTSQKQARSMSKDLKAWENLRYLLLSYSTMTAPTPLQLLTCQLPSPSVFPPQLCTTRFSALFHKRT